MANGDYEATHKKILDCGKNIFKTQGFEKANLRAICKSAGVTTGAFYGHFEDKEALLLCMKIRVLMFIKEKVI